MKRLLSDFLSALRQTKQRSLQAKECGLHPDNSCTYWIVKDGVAKWEIQVTRLND